MKPEIQKLIHAWFDGLNHGNIKDLVTLFAPSPLICNAANPPFGGEGAAAVLLEEFFRRTSARNFVFVDAAQADDQLFVTWTADLTFAAGTNIAGVILKSPLTVPLRGVDRFRLNDKMRIIELDIVHETSSVAQAAKDADEASQGGLIRSTTKAGVTSKVGDDDEVYNFLCGDSLLAVNTGIATLAGPAKTGTYEVQKIIETYFAAEEAGDDETVVELCSQSVVIRNAAQPPYHGKDGARRFVSDFRERTEQRKFKLLKTASAPGLGFAWWEAHLKFKAGVKFGSVVTERPFDSTLRGVCRFKLNFGGLVTELDVFHETTTPFVKAQEAAKP